MREHKITAKAERTPAPGPGDVRSGGMGIFRASHVRQPGRSLVAGGVTGPDGRARSGELGSESDSSREIDRYRTWAIGTSGTSVAIAGLLWALKYFELIGPR